jgi:hypothetical protein
MMNQDELIAVVQHWVNRIAAVVTVGIALHIAVRVWLGAV